MLIIYLDCKKEENAISLQKEEKKLALTFPHYFGWNFMSVQ